MSFLIKVTLFDWGPGPRQIIKANGVIYGGGFGPHDTGSASGGAGGYGPCVQTFRAAHVTKLQKKTLDTGLG